VKILAIETATPASSVAIGEDGLLQAMSVRTDPRGHVGFLVPAIDFCFAQTGWRPGELDLIAVDIGPGPYTGIRAGIATAQAIAAAVGVPIVTVSSLTILALRAATGRRKIYPVVDVRRGQVATCAYRPVPGGVVRDGMPEILGPEEFRAALESDSEETLLVGDVPSLPDEFFRGLHRVRRGRPRYPSAEVVLEVGALQGGHEDFTGSQDLQPLYMREPDAAINWSSFREEGVWPGETS
jgi:tRNA threonylcarbamoyladenosine biosynthesis protein TsaB